MLLLTVTVQDSYVIAITREGFDWNPIGRARTRYREPLTSICATQQSNDSAIAADGRASCPCQNCPAPQQVFDRSKPWLE